MREITITRTMSFRVTNTAIAEIATLFHGNYEDWAKEQDYGGCDVEIDADRDGIAGRVYEWNCDEATCPECSEVKSKEVFKKITNARRLVGDMVCDTCYPTLVESIGQKPLF